MKKTAMKGNANNIAATGGQNIQCINNDAACVEAQVLNNWKAALQLAMRGNLWYMHCDEQCGVTSDPNISQYIEFDVLCASTIPAKKMLAHGYERVTGQNYAVLLHTLLKLSGSKFAKNTANSFSVQYNRHVYNK